MPTHIYNSDSSTCSFGETYDRWGECAAAEVVVDHRFNIFIRQSTIYMLGLSLLYMVALYIVRFFLKKGSSKSRARDGNTDRSTLWVCAFTLSVAMASTFVYPVTIMSNELLVNLRLFPSNYRWYFNWLDRELILGYWSSLSFLSNIVLFVLIPFTVFYSEVMPLHVIRSRSVRSTNSSSIFPGLNRVCLSLGCLWLLIGGWMYVILSWVGQLPRRYYNVFAYLPYLHSSINFVGALLFFRCVPSGILKVIEVTYELRLNTVTNITRGHLDAMVLERNTLQRKVDALEEEDRRGILEQMLQHTDSRIGVLERELGRTNAWLWNSLFLMFLLLVMVLSIMLVTRMLVHCLALMTGLVHVDHLKEFTMTPLQVQSIASDQKSISAIQNAETWNVLSENRFGIESLSAFSYHGALLECVLVLYYMATGVVGFYSLEYVKSYTPTPHNVSNYAMVGHMLVLLLFSSALNVMTHSIGLTALYPIEKSIGLFWLNTPTVVVYNISFVFYFTRSLASSNVLRNIWNSLALKRACLVVT
eukprot:CFRG5949T1